MTEVSMILRTSPLSSVGMVSILTIRTEKMEHYYNLAKPRGVEFHVPELRLVCASLVVFHASWLSYISIMAEYDVMFVPIDSRRVC